MAAVPPPTPAAPKYFGRFELRAMLGRSHASSSWLALDPRLHQDVLLCVPRAHPNGNKEMDAWNQEVVAAARLKHPRLAEVLEVGSHEGWPFITSPRGGAVTLAERVAAGPPPTPLECATWLVEVLEGLAYAHEGRAAHHDIGLHNILIDANGHAQLASLSVGLALDEASKAAGRQQIREAAERDVLMAGLLLHRLLAGHPALDDADLGSAAKRVGPEIVRLPWTTAHPVSETLRAIVNRATDRQQRQRYLNARTLLSALQGWVKTNSHEAGGPLLLLLDRLNTVGHLPGRPATERALSVALSQEALRVDDFVDVIAKNPSLVWEMLRSTNTASFKSHSADEGVTTLSRAIVLLGQQGLRRVAGSIRPWPGVLGAQASRGALEGESGNPQAALEIELKRACLAGQMARLLVPANVSDEEAMVAAMSQRLGILLVLYHFPDEAAQINRLMQPGQPTDPDEPPTPGMTQDAAASAVLGTNLDDLSAAVLRHWGMHERLMQAARPLSRTTPVRRPADADAALRAVASLANELMAAAILEPAKSVSAMHQTAIRYARALDVSPKECNFVLEQATRLIGAGGVRPETVTPA